MPETPTTAPTKEPQGPPPATEARSTEPSKDTDKITHDHRGSPLPADAEPVKAEQLNELQAEAQKVEDEETAKRVQAQAGAGGTKATGGPETDDEDDDGEDEEDDEATTASQSGSSAAKAGPTVTSGQQSTATAKGRAGGK